ncbi:hypothetical protein [Mucilaginibacter sp.]|uniref:hypothetical protein n=1 Tax=Mucilaginibacter sp. TaxID=1882438 RepID=UPI003266F09A
MYKKTISPILLVLFCANAYAQNKVNFEIALSETKTSHSLYNSIDLADTRTDTNNFGYVQTGVYNKVTTVIPHNPFSAEIKRVLASLVSADAGNGELLLQLRQFSFAELTGVLGEYGYCTVKAEMYVKNGTGYQKTTSLDTLVQLRSSIDVTNPLLRSGSRLLTAFIQANLTLPAANDARVYTYNEVVHIDSIEKKALPLYNAGTYTNGLYLTYQSFKNQLPDKRGLTTENDYVHPGFVKIADEKGKLRDVKLKKTYAIVYKGMPYIATEFGFYPLTKINNEFTFTGMAKTPPSIATLIVVNGMFGATGTLANSGDEDTFEMKIDHQNGSLIKLKVIPKPKTTGSGNDGWD